MDEEHTLADSGKMKWTKMMVTRLIDMYKERTCLYDSRIPSSREQRNACIQEIAVELGISGWFKCSFYGLFSNNTCK